MSKLLLLLLLCALLTVSVSVAPRSYFKATVALYCPIKGYWEYFVRMWESNEGGSTDRELQEKHDTTFDQLVFIDLQYDLKETSKKGNEDDAEIEFKYWHNCTKDGKDTEWIGALDELKIPLGKKYQYGFKAVHLDRENAPGNAPSKKK
ncbi:hypothetical protein GCK72_011520 [Caenorhabditis remanei]|uniref:Uncharacterized protein n=1 Tax=Caenorhabditis remanei TaxID=31234 RepID=A0A6A5H8Y8_CAERE|nr:hypothetical protein GCK72_011520 [Caenorhabditis remanei]KAF1763254.1 hypothetical protein GCK72_011520 [Caenorhabditis remanei]